MRNLNLFVGEVVGMSGLARAFALMQEVCGVYKVVCKEPQGVCENGEIWAVRSLVCFCSLPRAESEFWEMGNKSTCGGRSERKSVNFRSLSFDTVIGVPGISEDKWGLCFEQVLSEFCNIYIYVL
uniref:Uncharacterized protein n=1 Tax=Molossus molossus TaxID=27622 RepID=A0A7J8EE42_MOLMO|nr:hypothetical protein HJG59_008851 [Molossus molossus]